MSVNISLLAQKVSGKQANVRVRVRPGIVQIQRGRPGIRSVVPVRTHDRQALNDLFPPARNPAGFFSWFPFMIFLFAILSSRQEAFQFRTNDQKSANNAFHQ